MADRSACAPLPGSSCSASSSQWPPITNSWLLNSCTSCRTLRACSSASIVLATSGDRPALLVLESIRVGPLLGAHRAGAVAEPHAGARCQEILQFVPVLARPDPLATAADRQQALEAVHVGQ